jgi:hypothetical protein
MGEQPHVANTGRETDRCFSTGGTHVLRGMRKKSVTFVNITEISECELCIQLFLNLWHAYPWA